MTRVSILVALLCLLPRSASADGRINFRIDLNHTNIEGMFNDVGIGWQGLEVELIQMAGPLPVAALVAGEIDYLTGFTTGLVAAAQGAPLKGIMVTMRKPPFYIVAEPAIHKPADLADKRIGVDRKSVV